MANSWLNPLTLSKGKIHNGGREQLVPSEKIALSKNTQVKRYGNLFQQIVQLDNLYLAYKKARKGKTWQDTIKQFERHLHRNILAIHNSLVNKTFTTSRYTERIIYEPKRRTIYKLPFNPDRIVQHALMNVIEPIWDSMFISDSYSCRIGKGIHAGSKRTMEFIRQVGENGYCLKMDVSKFYPSIVHDILFDIISHKIKCRDTLWLFHDIIYSIGNGKNVPIGNYTSQWFGNLYLNELDQWLKHVHKIKLYIRYCDDFLILHRDKLFLHDMRKKIEEFLLKRLQLRFSKSDIFPIKHGIDFLGYRHFPNYILLRKSTAKRIKKRLRNLPILLKKGKISQDQYISSIASTLGWLKWANAYNFRKATNIDKLWKEIKDAKQLSSIQ